MVDFILLPALAMGLIIGIYETILLHRDVTVPTHRFGHMIQALIYAVIAVFITMNAGWVYHHFAFLHSIPFIQHIIVFQIAVGLITVLKIHGASAAIRSSIGGISVGMKETWAHSFMIGALVVAAPYIWPFIAPLVPAWFV